ncbi:MAG TPA: hypothetical protein VK859_09260, partial [bacterium]|nr:hypothetical protein [bacterium]
MKWMMVLAALWVFTASAWAGSEEPPPDSLNLEAGGNLYGQSLDLSLSRRIFSHLYLNLGIEGNKFSYGQGAGSDFFAYTNPTTGG